MNSSIARPMLAHARDAEPDTLITMGKLTPLGDPALNAPEWFAAVEMIRLATDQD
jgi:hypothetical protein